MKHSVVWLVLTDVLEERTISIFRLKDIIDYKFVVCSLSALIWELWNESSGTLEWEFLDVNESRGM